MIAGGEQLAMSIAQVMEQYQSILEEEVHAIAYETGTIKRQRQIDAATLAQTMIFGFWQDPEVRLSGLAQSWREKGSPCDRISDQPTFYSRMCPDVSEHPATASRSAIGE
jgi:hypothetical protein